MIGCQPGGQSACALQRLLGLLCDEGELLRVGTLYFHRLSIQKAREALIQNGKKHGAEILIPELRDTLGTSRKFMIPLLEYFDGSAPFGQFYRDVVSYYGVGVQFDY